MRDRRPDVGEHEGNIPSFVRHSDVSLHPGHDAIDVERAGLPRDLLPFPIEDHRGYTPDAVAPGDLRLRLSVELGKARARLEQSCRALVRRRHHSAWTAPGRPEIDDQRNLVGSEVPIE